MKPKCRCARLIDSSNNDLFPIDLNDYAARHFHIAYFMTIKIYIRDIHNDLMCKSVLKKMIQALHRHSPFLEHSQILKCTCMSGYNGTLLFTVLLHVFPYISTWMQLLDVILPTVCLGAHR